MNGKRVNGELEKKTVTFWDCVGTCFRSFFHSLSLSRSLCCSSCAFFLLLLLWLHLYLWNNILYLWIRLVRFGLFWLVCATTRSQFLKNARFIVSNEKNTNKMNNEKLPKKKRQIYNGENVPRQSFVSSFFRLFFCFLFWLFNTATKSAMASLLLLLILSSCITLRRNRGISKWIPNRERERERKKERERETKKIAQFIFAQLKDRSVALFFSLFHLLPLSRWLKPFSLSFVLISMITFRANKEEVQFIVAKNKYMVQLNWMAESKNRRKLHWMLHRI